MPRTGELSGKNQWSTIGFALGLPSSKRVTITTAAPKTNVNFNNYLIEIMLVAMNSLIKCVISKIMRWKIKYNVSFTRIF